MIAQRLFAGALPVRWRQRNAATGLDDIADDAGYSTGAVYSNFRDKPTLCRAEMEAWLERTIGDVGWTVPELKFAMLSRREKGLTPMITDLHAGMQATVEAALASVAERVGSIDDLPISVAALADPFSRRRWGSGCSGRSTRTPRSTRRSMRCAQLRRCWCRALSPRGWREGATPRLSGQSAGLPVIHISIIMVYALEDRNNVHCALRPLCSKYASCDCPLLRHH
jgi:AcrR family transcriptional regulator